MTKTGDQNRLTLSFHGEGFPDGEVPFPILTAKLQALQSLVLHAAATLAGHSRDRRGLWANRYREYAELRFVAAHHSDLVIEAALPEQRDELTGDTFRRHFTVGQVLDLAETALNGTGADAPKHSMRPEDRGYLLKALESLCPNATEEYTVTLKNGVSEHPPLVLSRHTRNTLREAMQQVYALRYEDEMTIVGTLTKIHVDIEPEIIAVMQRGRSEINCFFGPWMRDQITNLVAGSVVEVTGRAVLTPEGNIRQLDHLLSVEPMSMDPIRFLHFEHEGKRYRLKEAISVTVDYTDDMWSYTYEPLNLWGVGERREDALHDLQANFDYIYTEFALEENEALDKKAKEIKQLLLTLVEPQ